MAYLVTVDGREFEKKSHYSDALTSFRLAADLHANKRVELWRDDPGNRTLIRRFSAEI